MAGVLGRVVNADLGRPRGPDASHRIRVPHAWLKRGAVVELELPRHLVCAACDGGGCDTCERSGAVTVRERGEPADLVEVTLPGEQGDTFVIRLPERGGLPPQGSGLPRGNLLLRVEPSAQADPSVTLASRNSIFELARRALSTRPAATLRYPLVLGVAAVGVILLVIWLTLRR